MLMTMQTSFLRGVILLVLSFSLFRSYGQISPVSVGQTKTEGIQLLTENEEGIKYEAIEESADYLQVRHID